MSAPENNEQAWVECPPGTIARVSSAVPSGSRRAPFGTGVVVGIIIYVGAHRLLLKPKKASIGALETQLTGLQAKIQEGRAAQQQLPEPVHPVNAGIRGVTISQLSGEATVPAAVDRRNEPTAHAPA